MTKICQIDNRGIVSVAGGEAEKLLQSLVTNDVTQISPGGAGYGCLLTPQGKFLHDFLVTRDGAGVFFLECEAARAPELIRSLKIYAMRTGVEVADASEDYRIFAAWDMAGGTTLPLAEIWYRDPRLEELGFRAVIPVGQAGEVAENAEFADYDRLRIASAVPDGSRDMIPQRSTLLDHNIDALGGIAWKKGCYVGQEVTARMHYRGLVKKRLLPVKSQAGTALPETGAEVTDGDGRRAGEMRSICGDSGLALLRLEKAGEALVCDGAKLEVSVPEYLRKKM
ncbi:MAG: folate-binding protein [Micavibrio sp.]|nr:MAG: folate-binding protein [Micavibrio sp.]